MLTNNNVRESLRKCGDTSAFSAKPADMHEEARNIDSSFVKELQRETLTSRQVIIRLSAEDRARLPGVYLRLEGLMALCRPDFDGLFDDKSSQAQIRAMADAMWSKRASEVHRMLFSLKSLEVAPSLELQLRKVSYELDLQILRSLSANERVKLADLISKSLILDKTVRGAPAY